MNEESFAAAVRDIRTGLLWSIKRAGYAKTKRERQAEMQAAYAFASSLDILRRRGNGSGVLPVGYEEYQITRGDFDAAMKYVGADGTPATADRAELLGEFSEFKFGLRK
jgi:hypothetical protein